MKDLFAKTINKYNLLNRKDKVVVAVSGGPDSICLLYLLLAVRKDLKLKLYCAHFNHGLRAEADAEESFVKNLCGNLGISFVSEKKDLKKIFKGDSLEQAARKYRRDFLVKYAREIKAKKIALGHHRADVAETVLMRVIRGAGLQGLRSILPSTRYRNLYFIRPLIEIDKKNIIDWLRQNKKEYKIDKTNLENNFLRNRVRNNLIPYLRQFNPAIEGGLFNLATTAAIDYDFIYQYCYGRYQKIRKVSGRKIELSLDQLMKMHPAVMIEVIRIAVEEIKGNLRKLELKHFQEIKDLLKNRPSGSIVFLPDLTVKKGMKVLIIESLLL